MDILVAGRGTGTYHQFGTEGTGGLSQQQLLSVKGFGVQGTDLLDGHPE